MAPANLSGSAAQVAASCLGTLTYAVEQFGDRDAATKNIMNEASLPGIARVKEQTPDFTEFATKMANGMEAAKRADGKWLERPYRACATTPNHAAPGRSLSSCAMDPASVIWPIRHVA